MIENPYYSQEGHGPYELHDIDLEEGGTFRGCRPWVLLQRQNRRNLLAKRRTAHVESGPTMFARIGAMRP